MTIVTVGQCRYWVGEPEHEYVDSVGWKGDDDSEWVSGWTVCVCLDVSQDSLGSVLVAMNVICTNVWINCLWNNDAIIYCT
jgi:hypothetical protein